MSTTTIRETILIDNVATNVTSVVFSDPTGTFGLKRTDTDAILIADGVALANTATGIYEHTFTDPGGDIPYTYWIEFVYNGETYRFEKSTISISALPTCIYCTYDEFLRRWGTKNVLVASNKENTSAVVDTDAVQQSFDYAVSELHRLLRGGIWAIPLTWESGITEPIVKDWVMTIAYENLYNARGMREDKISTHLTRQLDIVFAKIAGAKSGQLFSIDALTDTTVSVDHSIVDLTPADDEISQFWWNARKAVL
jgi:hypothetical protein